MSLHCSLQQSACPGTQPNQPPFYLSLKYTQIPLLSPILGKVLVERIYIRYFENPFSHPNHERAL